MFWIALLIRIITITLGHTYRIRIFQDHFQFGWEMGRVARALATGYGYADPFVGHTGPTAWVPPLYPLLMAAVFKLFGIYTALSAWILLVINSVFSAATAPAIYEIAARCYNRKVAIWSAWLWTLYPVALQYAVHWIWEMSLTTMLFSFALVLALRMRGIGDLTPVTHQQSTRRWLLFGLLWGLIALSNSSLLLFLPACSVWILLGAPDKPTAITRATLAAVLFLVVIAPWIWRNWIAFHAFIPMRSNLGAEFYTGSGPGSNGFPFVATLPLVERDPTTMRYKALGEIAWVREQGTKARAYISAHPAHYALITLKRIYFYWVSVPHPEERSPAGEFLRELNYCFLSITGWLGLLLSLRNRIPAAWLFTWAFLLLPFTYYFVTVNARFRHPLEPLIAILTVYLFQSARPRRQETT
ncbi:MAG: glycosyltransferase family 39 protein [Silvibacterium sp.]|nr:glycosyltransferase family 39 protein [Silvibacterium sp.]